MPSGAVFNTPDDDDVPHRHERIAEEEGRLRGLTQAKGISMIVLAAAAGIHPVSGCRPLDGDRVQIRHRSGRPASEGPGYSDWHRIFGRRGGECLRVPGPSLDPGLGLGPGQRPRHPRARGHDSQHGAGRPALGDWAAGRHLFPVQRLRPAPLQQHLSSAAGVTQAAAAGPRLKREAVELGLCTLGRGRWRSVS